MEAVLVILLVVVVAAVSYARGFSFGTQKGLAMGRIVQIAMTDVESALLEAHDGIEQEFGDGLSEEVYAREFAARVDAILATKQEEFVARFFGGNQTD